MTKHMPGKAGDPLPIQDNAGRVLETVAAPSFSMLRSGREGPAAVEVSQEAVARMIREWRARSQYFPGDLLGDPAWAMLLELLHSELSGRKVPLSRLAEVAALPVACALRWLKALEDRRLVVRDPNHLDPARELVGLATEASLVLRRYVRDVVLVT